MNDNNVKISKELKKEFDLFCGSIYSCNNDEDRKDLISQWENRNSTLKVEFKRKENTIFVSLGFISSNGFRTIFTRKFADEYLSEKKVSDNEKDFSFVWKKNKNLIYFIKMKNKFVRSLVAWAGDFEITIRSALSKNEENFLQLKGIGYTL